jgi:hypothetical protein
LDLDERRRQHVLRVRYQHRQLRSATARVLEVRYRSARTPAGCLHPGELAAIAPQRLAFCHDTMAEVVRLRCVELRQREEVRVELAARGVPVPSDAAPRAWPSSTRCSDTCATSCTRAAPTAKHP